MLRITRIHWCFWQNGIRLTARHCSLKGEFNYSTLLFLFTNTTVSIRAITWKCNAPQFKHILPCFGKRTVSWKDERGDFFYHYHYHVSCLTLTCTFIYKEKYVLRSSGKTYDNNCYLSHTKHSVNLQTDTEQLRIIERSLCTKISLNWQWDSGGQKKMSGKFLEGSFLMFPWYSTARTWDTVREHVQSNPFIVHDCACLFLNLHVH